MLTIILATVGVYAIGCWLYQNALSSLITIAWELLVELRCGKRSLAERYGKWAAITGATDGIGKGYATHLAKRGMNLVLISRSEPKLNTVAQEIRDRFNVQVEYIVADFSNGMSIYPTIRKQLSAFDIGIMVNNVGIAPECLDDFDAHSEQEYQRMINVNVLPVLQMTYMVLPRMKLADRGLIINISSASAHFPAPYLAVYSASKAFGHNLTLALQHELRGTRVECQLVVPNFVRTNLTDSWNVATFGGPLIPDWNTYGRWATWMIGKTEYTSGHWYHAVEFFFARLLPHTLLMRFIGVCFKYMRERQVKR